jgi:hypothetical protein
MSEYDIKFHCMTLDCDYSFIQGPSTCATFRCPKCHGNSFRSGSFGGPIPGTEPIGKAGSLVDLADDLDSKARALLAAVKDNCLQPPVRFLDAQEHVFVELKQENYREVTITVTVPKED